jgi:hypothetical protein
MSYIKNCTKCGQKISLREMSHGQWVAFDASTDKPHKHGKGSRKKASTNRQSKHIEREVPTTTNGFSTGQIVTISIAVIFILFAIFS